MDLEYLGHLVVLEYLDYLVDPEYLDYLVVLDHRYRFLQITN